MKIYMAGKISKNDWRHEIVPKLRDSVTNKVPEKWESVSFALGDSILQYVGPFFISCDHGCAHGRGEHGSSVATNNVCGDEVWGSKHYSSQIAKEETFHRCLSAIHDCDLFFAWLDQRDAHGTLVEIGVARALGKTIWIGSPPGFDVDDFWFAAQASVCGVIYASKTPKENLLKAITTEKRAAIDPPKPPF